MLDHHLQRSIVYSLSFAERLRFSQMQPDDIESKLFTYHLKKVIAAGYVAKLEDGSYALTASGRLLRIEATKQYQTSIDRAYSTLFLVIRRKQDGAWLLYKRHTHPLFMLTGLLGTIPNALEVSTLTAAKACEQKTGLIGDFEAIGSGYLRLFRNDELESFTHFTLLACDDIQGKLSQNDERGEYFWTQSPEFDAPDMLPNVALLCGIYLGTEQAFTERTYRL
jgi:hypothetical protein